MVTDKKETLRSSATDFFRTRHVTRKSGSASRTLAPPSLLLPFATIYAFPASLEKLGWEGGVYIRL